jgi:hypothetical protein
MAFECNEKFAKMICDGLLKAPLNSQQLNLLQILMEQNLFGLKVMDA